MQKKDAKKACSVYVILTKNNPGGLFFFWKNLNQAKKFENFHENRKRDKPFHQNFRKNSKIKKSQTILENSRNAEQNLENPKKSQKIFS